MTFWRTKVLGLPPVGRASASSVTIGGGDVAQVSSLPVGIAQAFGINTDTATVTRKEAMTIPAVRRGRMLIAGTIGTFPLMCTRTKPDGTLERIDSALLEQPDWNTTAQWVFTWTADDLLFYGISWWLILERSSLGYPVKITHLQPWRVVIDYSTGTVRVDGQDQTRNLIRFDGPDEGVLRCGARTLRTSILLEDAVRRYAIMDVPMGLLHDTRTDGDNLSQTEIDNILATWRTARAQYGTGFLGKSLEYTAVQFNAQQLQLVEGRQQQAVEIARLMNLPAGALNAPDATGMTYKNGEAERRALRDTTLAHYLTAIAQRLSLPDVTPRGQRVEWDLSKWLRGDVSEAVLSAVAASGGPVLTTDEAREQFLDKTPMAVEPAPAPAEPAPEGAPQP